MFVREPAKEKINTFVFVISNLIHLNICKYSHRKENLYFSYFLPIISSLNLIINSQQYVENTTLADSIRGAENAPIFYFPCSFWQKFANFSLRFFKSLADSVPIVFGRLAECAVCR